MMVKVFCQCGNSTVVVLPEKVDVLLRGFNSHTVKAYLLSNSWNDPDLAVLKDAIINRDEMCQNMPTHAAQWALDLEVLNQ